MNQSVVAATANPAILRSDRAEGGNNACARAVRVGIAFVLLLFVGSTLAQNTNSGDIRGTATDTTGAVIPGVTITVVDVDKGVATTYVTDGAGLYDTGSIVPDRYTVTFTKDGFASFVRGPFTLLVQTLTIDGHLTPGSTTQTVHVTTDAPLLETETGALSTTLTGKELTDLPNFASWETFTILMPGASGTPSNGLSNVDPGQAVSVNGNATFYNLLDDGAVVTMPDSGNGEDYPIDILAEVKMDTNAFGAQYANGGVIYNSISKGGSNQFHGDVFDYFQNTALNAAPYSFGAPAAVPVIRANFYGGSIGGPIVRNKLFFFANVDITQKYGGSSNGFVTVPTATMLAGDFTGFPTIYDPTTQTVGAGGVVQRASFASEYGSGNKIPASMIDPVANAIQKFYPAPNVPGVTTNGITTNNFFYNVPSNSPEEQWFWRIDYDISPKNRLTVTDLQNTGNTPNLGIGICPIDCYNSSGTAAFAEATDVWTFSPEANNEFRFGMANEIGNYLSETVNQGYPAKLGLLFAKGNEFPSININSEFELQPGIDSTQHQSDFNPSDVVTLIRGKHILHFGGDELIQRNNSTAWGNVQAANLQFTGQYTASSQGTQNISGVPYADFLLGQAESWTATNTPEEGTRYKVVETFFQDDIKIHPNLTLNAGLRWEGFTGIGEIHGNALSFDPTIMNPANNTLGAMWNGITKANGRKDIQAGVWDNFLPRLGLAWQPRSNTVVRGGFGLFAYPFSGETTFGLGSALGSSGSQYDATNGVSPVVLLNSSGDISYQGSPGGINTRYLNAPLTPDGYNGQSVPYNQYHTPVTKIFQYNLTIERGIGSGMAASASYVGSHGFDETFAANINQVPEDMLGPNDASGPTNARPYTLFQGISGATHNAISNYNALQTAIQGRWGFGPQFNINYTWSKYLDESDICPWNCGTKAATYQNAYVPSENYGPSDFDIRSMLKGRIFYPLPVGKGQRFLNNNSIPSEILGGWRIAGTVQWQSGNPFTPAMVNNTSYAQAGAQYPNLVGNPKSGPHGTPAEWFNVNAFAAPAPGTFGDVRSNSVRGPGLSNVNLSLGKNFSVWEKAILQIRVDATNAFNHPSFGLPDTGIGPGHTGQITSVTVGGRSAELIGRLSF